MIVKCIVRKIVLITVFFLTVNSASPQGIYHLWGTAENGGVTGNGSLFRMGTAGNNYTDFYGFNSLFTGVRSGLSAMTEVNGKFYGVAYASGQDGAGLLFQWDPITNSYTVTKDAVLFNGRNPVGQLKLLGGKLYGVTYNGGANNEGIIFEWDISTNTVTKKIDMSSAGGSHPLGIFLHSNGLFYGAASNGGVNNVGTLFEWNPVTNAYSKKIDMSNAGGINPTPGLAEKNGKFYGVTLGGGANNTGALFEWDPVANIYINKYDLTTAGGYLGVPFSNYDVIYAGQLVLYNNKLYGMLTYGGNNGDGTLFEWDPDANIYTVKIHMATATGANPLGGLSLFNGKFYGAASAGGYNGLGVLFEWDPVTNIYTNTLTMRSLQAINSGTMPYSFLTLFNNKFYGATNTGGSGNWGAEGAGTIYEWDPASNAFTTKLFLNTSNSGSSPAGSLALLGGKVYGMTTFGNTLNKGVTFEFDPVTATYTKKITLAPQSASIMGNPYGGLAKYNNKLYGMVSAGGTGNGGAIFEWEPVSNVFTNKFEFGSLAGQGSGPRGNLTLLGSKFYGMTANGGANSYGVIFEWDPSTNTYTKKIDFTGSAGSARGAYPFGSLSYFNGKFYGVTTGGGPNSYGVIFEWDPVTNVYNAKYDLQYITGVTPMGSLTLWNNKFYGSVSTGANFKGGLFEWDPVTNIYTDKFYMSAATGAAPVGDLALVNNHLYGMTTTGGANDRGVVFEWNPASNNYTVKKHFDYFTGSRPSFSNSLSAFPAPVANGLPGGCANFPSITIDNSNNSEWVPVVDNAGNAVAEINANGQNLGTVSIQGYINNGSVREDGTHRLYLDRSLTITPQTQPLQPVNIRLYVKGSEFLALKNATNLLGQPSGVLTINDVAIFKNTDGCIPAVQVLANPVTTIPIQWGETDYVLTASINSFSSFYFSNKSFSALPLHLLEFSGRLQNNNVLLDWKTENEMDVKDFGIQRSLNGRDYVNVGNVDANDRPGIQQYNFNDPGIVSLGTSVLYYRLKQNDKNGQFSYSNIVTVKLNDNGNKMTVYPNPVYNKVNISIPQDWRRQRINYEISNPAGQVIQKGTITGVGQTVTLSVATLVPGTYLMHMRKEDGTSNVVIIQKQ